jgi:NAD(P)H-nitrite reductase large subunit
MGVAGATAAEQIRKRDPDGEITILNGEGSPFYFRPALSWLLKGEISASEIYARPVDWARKRNLAILNEKAVSVNAAVRTVTTESGQQIAYDKLLITAGAQALKPPWARVDLRGVFTYRTLGDALAIAEHVKYVGAKTAVVVGGGILGVELAEIFRQMGLAVTLAIRGKRMLNLLFDEAASSIVQRRMESGGVKIEPNANINSIIGKDGRVSGAELESGKTLACDIVTVAVGSTPDTGFLQGSGLTQDGHLIVNDRLETVAREVYSAGDVAVMDTQTGFVPCRTWLTAATQGRMAGANMTGAGLTFGGAESFFNASAVFGWFYAVIGRFDALDGGAIQNRVISHSGKSYVKMVTENGKIIGGVCLGDMRAALPIRRAVMESRVWNDDSRVE